MNNTKLCAQLTFILSQLPYTYINMIPLYVKEKIKNNMDLEEYSKYDESVVFFKQNIDCETIKFLILLLNKYLILSENDRKKLEELL